LPTYDLIKYLKEENPNSNFIFCMGTDLVKSFRTWENGEELAENQDFIILKRQGYEPDKELFPKTYRVVDTIIEGSSTKVRDRIKDQIEHKNKINLGINGLTTASVIKYIIDNALYQIPKSNEA
jgi:nicotinate-nucleotide adenylyltransferase